MTAEALFLTFAGSITAVADGLYILGLTAGANWLARTTHTRAAAIPIELKTRGLTHKLAAIDAIISVAHPPDTRCVSHARLRSSSCRCRSLPPASTSPAMWSSSGSSSTRTRAFSPSHAHGPTREEHLLLSVTHRPS